MSSVTFCRHPASLLQSLLTVCLNCDRTSPLTMGVPEDGLAPNAAYQMEIRSAKVSYEPPERVNEWTGKWRRTFIALCWLWSTRRPRKTGNPGVGWTMKPWESQLSRLSSHSHPRFQPFLGNWVNSIIKRLHYTWRQHNCRYFVRPQLLPFHFFRVRFRYSAHSVWPRLLPRLRISRNSSCSHNSQIRFR